MAVLLRNRLARQIRPRRLSFVVRNGSTISETLADHAIEQKEKEKRREAWLYFDSVFPIRFGLLDQRVWYSRIYKDSILDAVKKTIPQDQSDIDLQVEEVSSREKDGGAFVKVSYFPPAPIESEAVVGDAIEKWVRDKALESNVRYKPWFVFGPQQIHFVRGVPWLEDMDRFPNASLKVEFGPTAPSQEKLYDLFRPYGRIKDLEVDAKSATIFYRSVRSAAAARNCLDGYVINSGSTIHILYLSRKTGNAIYEWLSSHPRITIPILAVLLGGLSFIIFDPIRSFFVKAKVEGTFDANRYKVIAWLKKETLGRFVARSDTGTELSGIERERQDAVDVLETWLRDSPDGFTVVTGPRGSGKQALLDQVSKNHSRVITLDCEAILKKAETDDKMIAELARQLGYFPSFGFLSTFNNLIDLASVGLIGSKAGFSQSADAQLKQILMVSADALSRLASEARRKQKMAFESAEKRRELKDVRQEVRGTLEKEGLKDGRLDALAGNGVMSELGKGIEPEHGLNALIVAGPGSLNEAKQILSETDDQLNDADIIDLPVVIFKGFNSKGGRSKDVLWDSLSEWGASLVDNKIAHVIASSDNVLVTKPLAKALPSKPINSIALADASPKNAVDYITAKLKAIGKSDLLTPQNQQQILRLGGRLSDLEILTQKLQAGADVDDAVEDLISRATTEVRKNIFEEEPAKEWNKAQIWYLTKLLSSQEEASYEDILFNGPFKGSEKPLQALEQAEMISISHRDGQNSIIRAGRPVWRAAFERLTTDTVFSAIQELALTSAAISSAEVDVKTASDELIHLGALFPNAGKFIFTGSSTVPVEVAARVDSLLTKMRDGQAKLSELKTKESELKARLKK